MKTNNVSAGKLLEKQSTMHHAEKLVLKMAFLAMVLLCWSCLLSWLQFLLLVSMTDLLLATSCSTAYTQKDIHVPICLVVM